MRGFRVWCKNRNEWEQDKVALLPDGRLWDISHHRYLDMKNHIIEFETGLTDKNRVKIFDGDVISVGDDSLFVSGEVYCCNGCFGVDIDYDRIFTCFNEFTDESLSIIEVIGNIHDSEVQNGNN